MSSQLATSLELIRLLSRKGDLHDARVKADELMRDAKILDDAPTWLEATRLFFYCCQELDEAGAAQSAMDEILKFLATGPELRLQAQAETLISSWLLSQGKVEECQDYVQSAIHKATESQDLHTLARAFSISTFTLSTDPKKFKMALAQLEKLELILSQIDNPEIVLTSSIYRGFLLQASAQSEAALAELWKAYEVAKLNGFNLHVATILAQIARIHGEQKQSQEYRLYGELALKGLDRTKTPRLYRLIFETCPPTKENRGSVYDFVIDETSRYIRERTKGKIDFKNQHILFEMALLFIKNPGVRYNKEDLAKEIWQQTYHPDLHDNLIYVSIKRLRTLLEPDLESPRYVLRDRKGYYLNPQSAVSFKHSEEVTL